jgi:hypothetical protein
VSEFIPYALLGDYSGWMLLTPDVAIQVIDGRPLRLQASAEPAQLRAAVEIVETWAHRAVWLGDNVIRDDLKDGYGEWMMRLALPSPAQCQEADAAGRSRATFRARELTTIGPAGPYPGTVVDYEFGVPFEDAAEFTTQNAAIYREMARIAQRAAVETWNALRANPTILLRRIEEDIHHLEQEQGVLSTETLTRLRRLGCRLRAFRRA